MAPVRVDGRRLNTLQRSKFGAHLRYTLFYLFSVRTGRIPCRRFTGRCRDVNLDLRFCVGRTMYFPVPTVCCKSRGHKACVHLSTAARYMELGGYGCPSLCFVEQVHITNDSGYKQGLCRQVQSILLGGNTTMVLQ